MKGYRVHILTVAAETGKLIQCRRMSAKLAWLRDPISGPTAKAEAQLGMSCRDAFFPQPFVFGLAHCLVRLLLGLILPGSPVRVVCPSSFQTAERMEHITCSSS